MFKNIGLLVFMALFLGSCMMGPAFQKPEVNIPDSYISDHIVADSINLRWWELFNDADLDSMIVYALDHNKDIMMAAKRIEQARAYHGMVQADLWPALNIQAGASRGNFGGVKTTTINNNFYVTPALSWELDFWGKYRSLSQAALQDMIASEWGMRSMQISLISDVSSMYFQLLDYQKRLKISQKTVELRFNSLKIIRMRFDKGIIPEIDVNQAEAQWASAAASVPSYERAVAQTEYALSILLGMNPKKLMIEKNIDDEVAPPEIPAGIPSSLLNRRPDIAQAEASYRAQNARVGSAVASRLPSISLTGLLGVASNDLLTLTTGGLAWSAGASLLGPIFQFGKNKRRMDMEIKKSEELLISYESTVMNAFRDVEDALISIKTLQAELTAREILFKAVDNAARLSVLRYDKGVTSYLEVLENERSSFEAELALTQTKQELLNSYVTLYKALGGGWLSPQEEQAAQNAAK